MSVSRIITRIIPLNSSESFFQPASFESLTDGNVGNVITGTLEDPESGMKFRVETVHYVQNVRPDEGTVDSINADFAKRLEDIPGFVQLKANDMPFNPYDKSIQITLPKFLSGRNLNRSSMGKMSQENNNTESLELSVVKNDNFKNTTPKERDKKLNDDQYEFKNKKSRLSTENIQENNGLQSDSKFFKDFKTKCNYYLGQKTRNSAWGSKNKLSTTKQRKASPPEQKRVAESRDRNIEDGEKTDTSLDLFDYGDLVARALIPEDALQGDHNDSGGDSFHSLNLNTPEYSDDDGSCKYSLYPLSKLLMSLKKYFVNEECLICGFIPTESDFNPNEHLKTHISSNSFLFRFHCFCCDEKFVSPKDLYKHALSRDKTFKYMCTMCNLKFKRRYYLMRHNVISWKNHI